MDKEILSICDFIFPENKYRFETLLYDFSNFNVALEQIRFHREPIHLFMFSLDKKPQYVIQFIKMLQSSTDFLNHPIILFSRNKNDLSEALFELKPFQSILLPITQKGIDDLKSYIQFYYNSYQLSCSKIWELDFNSCFYRFPIDDILFAEAKNRKVLIHTKDDLSTEIPTTFHNVLERMPKNVLVQSHRSYIINPCNVYRIDKEAKHWIVSFYCTDKKALISKPYRQTALDSVFVHICRENSVQKESYPMIDMYYFQE